MGESFETADELLARMRLVHARCRSYTDEGTRTTRFEGGAAGNAEQLRFRTRWKRPHWFYFECIRVEPGPQEDWARLALWATPDSVRSWWSANPVVTEHEGLGQAIAGIGEDPKMVLSQVPSLLAMLPAPSRWFTEVESTGAGAEELDGVACSRITLSYRVDDPEVLWLERSSALIRRYDTQHRFSADSQRAEDQAMLQRLSDERESDAQTQLEFEDLRQSALYRLRHHEYESFTSRSTTIYLPRLDPELGDDDFLFVPPSSSSSGWA